MFYSGGHPKNLKWPMTIYDHLIAGATSLWKAELHRAGWQKRTAGWAQPSRKDHSLIESISREISGEWLGELFFKATIFIYLQGFGHLWKTYRTSKPAKFEKKNPTHPGSFPTSLAPERIATCLCLAVATSPSSCWTATWRRGRDAVWRVGFNGRSNRNVEVTF